MKNQKTPYAGIFLVFGTALGAGLGIILGQNMLVFAGIGTAVGLIIGAAVDSYKKKEQSP